MTNVTLYPELIDYIYLYCDEFRTADEKLASRSINWNAKDMNEKVRLFILAKNWYSDAENIKEMIKDGFEVFKYKVAARIFEEHKDELKLNLCPKCGKITRTPWAKQCRFCFYNWH